MGGRATQVAERLLQLAGKNPDEYSSGLDEFNAKDVAVGVASFGVEGGGGLTDPVTVPVNIATTDPDVQPLKITLPTGFSDGSSFVPVSIEDEFGKTLFEIDADGSVTFAPAAGESPTWVVANNGQGDFRIAPGTDNTSDLIATMSAPAGRISAFHINDPGSAEMHTFSSGDADLQVASALITNQATGKVGFFGTMPAERPVVPVTDPTIQNVIDALVTLGLVAQSD